jgi:N-acetylglucosaminyl-diphospho-decaprenol L-rhamnosyltransferase
MSAAHVVRHGHGADAPVELSIVVVNWNSKAHLRACLRSVVASVRTVTFDVTVVDAGSFDGCAEMLGAEFPQVQFIQLPTNCGFAAANNVAVRATGGAAILFLNPDTEVVGDAIDALVTGLRTVPDAGAVGAKLLNSDRSVQTSCIQAFPTLVNQLLSSDYLRSCWPTSSLWGMAPLFSESSLPQKVEGVSGACLLVTRTAFERVGGFSEEYFMYAEDLDLSYTLRMAGYSNYVITRAVVVHHGGGSSDRAPSHFAVVMMRHAVWRFFRKWRGAFVALGYRATTFASAVGRLAVMRAASASGATTRERAHAAERKWMAILRWSLNPSGAVSRLVGGDTGSSRAECR